MAAFDRFRPNDSVESVELGHSPTTASSHAASRRRNRPAAAEGLFHHSPPKAARPEHPGEDAAGTFLAPPPSLLAHHPADMRGSPPPPNNAKGPSSSPGDLERRLSRLCKASKMGRLDAVERALARFPKLAGAAEPGTGRTALHYAVRKNRVDVAAFLLANGADANAADRDGMAPLHLAAAMCDRITAESPAPSSRRGGPAATPGLDDSCSASAFDLDASADSSVTRTDVIMLRYHHDDDDEAPSPVRETGSPGRLKHPGRTPEAAQHGLLEGCPSMFLPGQPEAGPLDDAIAEGRFWSSSPERHHRRSPPDARSGPAFVHSIRHSPQNRRGLGEEHSQSLRVPGRLRMRRYQEAPGAPIPATGLLSSSSSPAPPRDQAPAQPSPEAVPLSHPLLDALLRHGALVDKRDGHGRTPLHWAAWKDKERSVAVLMRSGADPNLHDSDGRLPVHLASIAGSLGALRALLAFKVDWQGKDQAGRTALHLAAYWGQPVVVKEILSCGAGCIGCGCGCGCCSGSSECADDDGCTPLHLASWKGHLETIEELLQSGADTDAPNNLGHTPLHLSVMDGQQRAAEILLEAGADPGSRDNSDQSPLHAAARGGFTALSRELIRSGAAINVHDEAGCTPLHLAAAASQSQTLTELLHGGADPEAQDALGNTALHFAARSGCHEVVAAVLSATGGSGAASKSARSRRSPRNNNKPSGAPAPAEILTAVNKKGWTPLHMAAARGHAAAARLLLARGSAAKVPDANGRLPIHVASAAGHAKIVELLIRRKAATMAARDRSGATPLLLALTNRRADVVTALLNSGADPNTINELSGRTALSLAAERGSPELLSLLRHGAEVGAACVDGRTALHWAVDAQQVQTADELLVAGAAVDCKDAYGRTPLHWAAGRGGLEMLQVLVAAGSVLDLNSQDNAGRTPLHYAARMAQTAAMQELVKSGAKRSIKDADGKTAMHYCKGDWKAPKKVLNAGSGTAAGSAMRRLLRVCTGVVDQLQPPTIGAAVIPIRKH